MGFPSSSLEACADASDRAALRAELARWKFPADAGMAAAAAALERLDAARKPTLTR